jgi:hypothetical protein
MYFALASEVDQLQLLMDNTIKVKPTKKNSASVARLEGMSRRLMFKLHIKRTMGYKSLSNQVKTIHNECPDLTYKIWMLHVLEKFMKTHHCLKSKSLCSYG